MLVLKSPVETVREVPKGFRIEVRDKFGIAGLVQGHNPSTADMIGHLSAAGVIDVAEVKQTKKERMRVIRRVWFELVLPNYSQDRLDRINRIESKNKLTSTGWDKPIKKKRKNNKKARALKKSASTRTRRKAIAFIQDKLGRGHFYEHYGKNCPSNLELVMSLSIAGESVTGGLNEWSERRSDLKATPPKKKTKKQSYAKQSKDFLSSWEWRTLRYEILQKHGRRCMCCGATPDDGVTIICVDHIKPRHKFPALSLDPDNLQVLCGVCNQGKGAWDQTDFRDNVIEYDFQCKLASEAKDNQ